MYHWNVVSKLVSSLCSHYFTSVSFCISFHSQGSNQHEGQEEDDLMNGDHGNGGADSGGAGGECLVFVIF